MQSGLRAIIFTVLLGGLIGFVARWYYGLSYVALTAIVIAFLAARKGRLHAEKGRGDS